MVRNEMLIITHKSKYIHLITTLFLLISGWCIFFYSPVKANSNGMPISAQLEVPEDNKVPASSSVINMDVKPNEKIDFAVYLNNPTEDTLYIEVKGGIAHNDYSGNIDITSDSRKNLDESFRYSLADLGLTKQTVMVEPNSTKRVPLSVTAPSDFTGTISGSVIIRVVAPLVQHNQVNNFQIAYGVLVNVGDYDKIKPNLELSKVRIKSQSGMPVVVGRIHNHSSIYYGGGAVDYSVKLKNSSGKVIETLNSSQGALAANIVVPLTLDLGSRLIKPGNYHYSVDIDTGDSQWNFKRNFTISARQAAELNRKNLYLPKDNTSLIVVGAVLVVLLFILFLSLIFRFAFYRGRKTRNGS